MKYTYTNNKFYDMCLDSMNNKVYLLEDKKISIIDINSNNVSRSVETKEYVNNK